MAGFIRAHADDIEPSAIIGFGYSNGANILASVLFTEPSLFNAAVLMHPLIPFEPKVNGSLAGKQILVTAGRRDPICPPKLTSRLEAYLQAAGANVTLDWHDGGHELRTSEMNAVANFLGQFQPSEAWTIDDDGQPA